MWADFSFQQKRNLIILLIIAIALPLTIYLVKHTQIFSPKAQEVQQPSPETLEGLTNQLLQAASAQNPQVQGVSTQRDQPLTLVEIAQRRKEKALEEIEKDPQNFLLNSIPKEIREELPPPVQELVEKDVRIESSITALHFDGFTSGTSTEAYFTENNEYQLHFVGKEVNLLSGSTVNADSLALDDQAVIKIRTDGDIDDLIESPPQQSLINARGTHRFAFILVNFADDNSQPYKKSDLEKLMFDPATGLRRFYVENSFDQLYIDGQVFDWHQIPSNKPTNEQECDESWKNWRYVVNSQLQSEGINLGDYKHIVYVSKKSPGCPGGWGYMGGDPTYAWIFADDLADPFTRLTIAHELGHNFGINHANLLDCSPSAINIYSTCRDNEYSDPMSPMGNTGYVNFNSANKLALFWLSSNRIQRVTTSGEYSISPLNDFGQYPSVLIVEKPNTRESYFMEYRPLEGLDRGLNPSLSNGVTIRVWDLNPANQTKMLKPYGDLIASLSNGRNFHDDINGITITQQGIEREATGERVRLSIQFGTPRCAMDNPSLSISEKSQRGEAGQAVNYNFQVKNNDSPACPLRSFNLNTELPAPNWSGSLNSNANFANFRPGEARNYTYSLNSPQSAQSGVYRFILSLYTGVSGLPVNSVSSSYIVFDQTTSSSISPSPVVPIFQSSKTITSIKFDGQDVDLNNLQLRVHLPNITEGEPGVSIVKVDITYSDGTARTIYLPFNYLNDFTQIEQPPRQIIAQPSPVPENTPRCGLFANDSNINLSIAVGNYISFRITNIPEGATSAIWTGTGANVPSNISGFERGPNGQWTKIYGPYSTEDVGSYSRQVVVYDGGGQALCQSNRVDIAVLPALAPRGQYILRGNPCGSSSGSNAGLQCEPGSVCMDGNTPTNTYGRCTYVYTVPTQAPIGVIATPSPLPLTAPQNCRPNQSCNTDFECGGCGLRCVFGSGSTKVCK